MRSAREGAGAHEALVAVIFAMGLAALSACWWQWVATR